MRELLGAILVIGLVAVGIFQVLGTFSSASDQTTQQSMQTAVATSVSNISTQFGLNRNYNGFNDTVARQIGAVPQGWKGNGPFVMPSGGTVSFSAAAAIPGQADSGYSMTFTGVPSNVCQSLGSFTVPQMVSLKIGAAAEHKNPAYDSTATGTWPVPQATIASECGTGTVNVVMTMI